jgi:hypothetical protein
VLGAVLEVPVRGAAVLAGMAAARSAATLTAPALGTAQSPFIPFAVGAGVAVAAAAGSAMFRGAFLKSVLADVAAGAAAGATKNLVTAYWPEAQQFLGRHDDVMFFTRPGQSRPALAGYAGGLSSYPARGLAGYSNSGVLAYQ